MENNRSDDFKPVKIKEKFDSKEWDILERNKRFFSTDRKYVDEMLEIIDGKSIISIRVLDWFVANYSKKNNTVYRIRINGRNELFYVNNEYKNQLNGYSKNYFDPFCRKKKLIYSYKMNDGNQDIIFLSSIGQLNFFRWALCNKIIKYVQRHIKEIENDMKETNRLNKDNKLIEEEIDTTDKISTENMINDDPDPTICSSEKINSIKISPYSKSSSKSDSSTKKKRQQLSKSVYESGIKKSAVPIRLDFD